MERSGRDRAELGPHADRERAEPAVLEHAREAGPIARPRHTDCGSLAQLDAHAGPAQQAVKVVVPRPTKPRPLPGTSCRCCSRALSPSGSRQRPVAGECQPPVDRRTRRQVAPHAYLGAG